MSQLALFPRRSSSARLRKQRAILNESIASGTPLAEVLSAYGWTYDDLRYERDDRLRIPRTSAMSLDDLRSPRHSIPVVSFFAGAGGMDLGFEAAGYLHAALVEKNELFCDTIRRNRKEWNVLGPPTYSGDVSKRSELVALLLPLIGHRPFEGVFVGGPPCQPFSVAANQHFSKSGANFKRVGFLHELNGNLLFDYIALIKQFKPRAFLIENVPGLTDIDGGEQLQRAYGELEQCGFRLEPPMVLLASAYGIPQNRIRLFIVGNRVGRDFRRLERQSSQTPCAVAFMKNLNNVANHITREHTAQSIERYCRLAYGARDKLGRVDRLDPRLPSKTVIAGGTAGGGRSHLHPHIPRTLSVRESARLQTFPDDYIFHGPVARQFTQVGNAVPPALAAQLAIAVKKSFF